ncbi:MAG: hypothetical protein K1X72_13815 [Pyrinomonadaceae bacterium]|nr:hypothetical protein [Pyrinomonadaceae bacterium]
MNSISPKKAMEKLETILNAFEHIAPNDTFGGQTSAQFAADVQASRDVRAEIDDMESKLADLKVKRDNIDAGNLKKAELIVNGVVGDPNYGPDSSLYEEMGYIRKSNRKSGLTRKNTKNNNGKE